MVILEQRERETAMKQGKKERNKGTKKQVTNYKAKSKEWASALLALQGWTVRLFHGFNFGPLPPSMDIHSLG